jgi:hypothetical protein
MSNTRREPIVEYRRAQTIALHIKAAHAAGLVKEAQGWRTYLVNTLAKGEPLGQVPQADLDTVQQAGEAKKGPSAQP